MGWTFLKLGMFFSRFAGSRSEPKRKPLWDQGQATECNLFIVVGF
jgi:hypothetical protein